MKLDFWNWGKTTTAESASPEIKQEIQTPEPSSDYSSTGSGVRGIWYPVVNKNWDGEKTPGELGDVIRNIPDYLRLRLRSMDAYATTDIVKIITSKFFKWVIGSGLKLQVEANRIVLELEGINFDSKKFQKVTEARFQVYANSKNCDYSRQKNLHELADDFFQGSFLGGDTLVICRFEDYGPTAQFISGEHIRTPYFDQELMSGVTSRGNFVEHGIEYNQRGETVAFFINVKEANSILGKFERIAAYGEKTNRRLAWMIYGQKLSPDHKRGVPQISQILEKVRKLDRYTEASVAKAEQAAKIIYTIKHQEYSTGENPLEGIMKQKLKIDNKGVVDGYVVGDGLASRVAETTAGMAINLPPGAEFDSFDTNIESSFEQFYRAVFNSLCASVDIPPEVALQMYNSNYSASRAAINGWGYVVDIYRKKFTEDFYKPFYQLWLEFEILRNKIDAPGFILAITKNDFMITESYSQCRFTGKNMPHIDPLKEIKAIREMLGTDDTTALISREQAAESLNAGDWSENYLKNLEEEKIIVTPKPEENGITANPATK